MAEEEKFVELTVVRGTVCGGKDVKRGDKISVPTNKKQNGIYPVRWWVNNKKAARNKAEFEEFCGAVDVAVPGAEAK